MKAFLLALALGGLAGPALAHVTLSVTHAPAGGFQSTAGGETSTSVILQYG